MIKIAITPASTRKNEHLYIAQVLDAGWDWVHLRHPSLSEEELRKIIDTIDPIYYPKIKLHSYPQLVEEYSLGGVHLNFRMPVANIDARRYSISRSCHTISDVLSTENKELDYVTLSPIFDSISKEGYKSDVNAEQLAQIPSTPKVIALGGITPNRIEQLKQYNFAGYAVLGYLAQATTLQQLSSLLSEFN